ncbi:ThuA domain-containing protein [Siphonobacter sp. BAB-5405]|uniref:ThuA domain-containing protein n=1 Tax=Siphonobacter sp. BAB-5405 TaxID=1864825 RepID=UPI001304FB51|nr:ThuA domain-containing protein [Siphonobacter sp. BAB-5405]
MIAPITNGIHRSSKAALEQYVQKGGGLLALAFRAKTDTTVRSGWAAYSQLFRREKITDFRVDERVKQESHPLTKGLPSFRSKAAFQLKGTEPIEVIVRSKSTPLAWVYTFGQGRVFQTVLDPETSPKELWQRAANWV